MAVAALLVCLQLQAQVPLHATWPDRHHRHWVAAMSTSPGGVGVSWCGAVPVVLLLGPTASGGALPCMWLVGLL